VYRERRIGPRITPQRDEGRGRRDVPRASLRWRGLGCGSARLLTCHSPGRRSRALVAKGVVQAVEAVCGPAAGEFTRGLRAIAAFRRCRPRTGR